MLNGLKAKGMGYFKRYTIYWAVRLFGWTHWNGNNGTLSDDREIVE